MKIIIIMKMCNNNEIIINVKMIYEINVKMIIIMKNENNNNNVIIVMKNENIK